MKQCYSCHETKPIEEFYKHQSTKGRREGRCKSCKHARAKELYLPVKNGHYPVFRKQLTN